MIRTSSPTDRAYARPLYWGAGTTFFATVLFVVVSKAVEFRALWAVYSKTAFGSPTDDLNPATASALAACIGLTTFTLTAILLRRGAPIRQYLAIQPVDWHGLLPELVCGAIIGLVAGWIRFPPAADTLSTFVGQDLVIAYFLLVGLAVPVVEEALFRGFAIAGFLTSRFGSRLAVPLSAALWSLSHDESSWGHYAALFVLGCALSILRVRSSSLLPPLALHVALNLGVLSAAALLR